MIGRDEALAAAALRGVLDDDRTIAALRRAREAGYRVEIADLGDWGTRLRPVAELDAPRRCLRLDRHVLEAASARLGRASAVELAVAAIAHELAHAAAPDAAEGEIRAGVAASSERDPDALVRAALRPPARAPEPEPEPR